MIKKPSSMIEELVCGVLENPARDLKLLEYNLVRLKNRLLPLVNSSVN